MSFFARSSSIAIAAAAAGLISSAALAADPAQYEAHSYLDWSGLYLGPNIGFGGFGTNVTDLYDDMFDGEGSELNVFGNGFIGGGQVGYNFMEGRYVFGVEGDIQFTSYDERTGIDDDHLAEGSWNWFGTLRGRAGVADQDNLFYLTGGLAVVNAHFCGADGECVTDGDEDLAFDSTKLGYALGAGFESRIHGNWSMKGEYLFVGVPRFQRVYDSPDELASFYTQAHMVRVGLNYHIGGLGGNGSGGPIYAPFHGFYAGLNGGFGGFGTGIIDLDGDMFDGTGKEEGEFNLFGNGLVFGAQAGYNMSMGQYVLGVEGDFQGTSYSVDAQTDGGDHLAAGSWNWFSTIRGRAGRTFGDTLVYATGGLAIVNAHFCGADSACVTDGDEDLAFDETRVGYAIGGGVETKLTDRLSLKGEYLYIDALDFNKDYDSDQTANFRTDGHVFRVGMNFALN